MKGKDKLTVKIVTAFSVVTLSILFSLIFVSAKTEAPEVTELPDQSYVSNVGSVSKIYVTTAVLQLVDKGLVKLDEPVTTYIPDFCMEDERYKDITVRMLMNHSSGLMGSTWHDTMLYDDIDREAHDMLLSELSKQRLKAAPGEYGVYCNDGFFLLELLVESVSGTDYTTYLKENISGPLGLRQTGTPYDMFRDKNLMPVYLPGGDRFSYEYCMDVGSGGIIASAPDLCRFGTTFFTGDNTLLSDSSKEEMFKNYARDDFESSYGLGWDQVDIKEYSEAGIRALGKGGDTGNMHSYLLVAPDEKVSIAVNVSGGNSVVAAAMSEAVMEAILAEEKGIEISDAKPEIKPEDGIPEELKEYEGFYTDNSTLPIRVEFEGNYLKTTQCDTNVPETDYYRYAGNGGFVKLSGNPEENRTDKNGETWYFAKRENGRSYIKRTYSYIMNDLMNVSMAEYYAEKLESVSVSRDVLDAWREYEGNYYLYSGKYSDTFVQTLHGRLKVSSDIPGYAIIDSGQTCSTFIIEDETHLKAFVQIPCQNGRDLNDIEMEVRDGKILAHGIDSAQTLICDKSMPEFDRTVTAVETKRDEAVWFRLTDSVKGVTLTFEKGPETSIYVFDKYGSMIYSSYMLDYPNEIPLPSEGYIVFRGENGEKITLGT